MAMSLRVFIPSSSYVKTHMFDPDATVGQVKRWILTYCPTKEPSEEGDGVRRAWSEEDLALWGLLVPPVDAPLQGLPGDRSGTWLREDMLLGLCGLEKKATVKVLLLNPPDTSMNVVDVARVKELSAVKELADVTPAKSVRVRVVVPALRRQKFMEFWVGTTAAEAQEKIISSSRTLREVADTCALFIPYEDAVDDGVWLDPERTLDSYQLKDGDSMELRLRKHGVAHEMVTLNVEIPELDASRPLRFRLDGTVEDALASITSTFRIPLEGKTFQSYMLVLVGKDGHPDLELKGKKTLVGCGLRNQDRVRMVEKKVGNAGQMVERQGSGLLDVLRGKKKDYGLMDGDSDEEERQVKQAAPSPGKVEQQPKKVLKPTALGEVLPGQPLCALLVQDEGPLAGQSFRVGMTGAKIGRSRTFQNHIVIPGTVTHPQGDDSVSREHATIYYHDNRFFVRNLNKRNFTSIKKAGSRETEPLLRLDHFKEAQLSDGDWIFVGNKTILEVTLENCESGPCPATAIKEQERVQLEQKHDDAFIQKDPFRGEEQRDVEDAERALGNALEGLDLLGGEDPPTPALGGQPVVLNPFDDVFGEMGSGQPQQFPPAQPQQFPGQPQQFPGQPQQFPGQPQQFPGQPQQFPGQPQQFPGQPQQFPGQPQLPAAPQIPQGQGDFASMLGLSQQQAAVVAAMTSGSESCLDLLENKIHAVQSVGPQSVVVYESVFSDETCLGEICIEPQTTIGDVRAMIRDELLSPEDATREFVLKKKNVPMSDRQNHKKAYVDNQKQNKENKKSAGPTL